MSREGNDKNQSLVKATDMQKAVKSPKDHTMVARIRKMATLLKDLEHAVHNRSAYNSVADAVWAWAGLDPENMTYLMKAIIDVRIPRDIDPIAQRMHTVEQETSVRVAQAKATEDGGPSQNVVIQLPPTLTPDDDLRKAPEVEILDSVSTPVPEPEESDDDGEKTSFKDL